MFIRWIQRLSKTEGYGDALSLILAESKRVNGQPRQHHIAYLGGITTDQIADVGPRVDFWDQVEAAFAKLHNRVTPEDRHRFETAIAARVPRPTAAQREAVARDQEQREKERAQWWAENEPRVREFRIQSLLSKGKIAEAHKELEELRAWKAAKDKTGS